MPTQGTFHMFSGHVGLLAAIMGQRSFSELFHPCRNFYWIVLSSLGKVFKIGSRRDQRGHQVKPPLVGGDRPEVALLMSLGRYPHHTLRWPPPPRVCFVSIAGRSTSFPKGFASRTRTEQLLLLPRVCLWGGGWGQRRSVSGWPDDPVGWKVKEGATGRGWVSKTSQKAQAWFGLRSFNNSMVVWRKKREIKQQNATISS